MEITKIKSKEETNNYKSELSSIFPPCDWEPSVLLKSKGNPYGTHREQESGKIIIRVN